MTTKHYIPVVYAGFYYSSSADRSANDHTIHVENSKNGNYILGARYKNSAPNSLYEIELDPSDLIIFGQMLIDLAKVASLIENRKEVLKSE